MNSVIRVMRWFLLALVGFASVSAAGPSKIYTLTVTSTSAIVSGAIVPFTATFTNVSPAGNSSINSLELVAPPGIEIQLPPAYAVTVTNQGVAVPASNVSISATKITAKNLSPVGRNAKLVIAFSAKVTTTSCASLGWNIDPPAGPTYHAWSGSQFTGDEFAVFGTLPTTSIACSLVFSKPPVSTTFVNPTTPIKAAGGANVEVCLSNGASCDTTYAGNVTVSKVAGTGTLAGAGPVAASSGIATFASLSVSSTGLYKLQATDGTRSTPVVTIFVGEGVLSCEGAPGVHEFGDADGDPDTNGVRGTNKDGSDCIVVNYTFTDDIAINNRTIFSWDIGLQPGAVFKYSVKFLPEFVGTSGRPELVTKVQWFDSSGNPFPPDTAGPGSGAVPAKACLSKDMPTQYGTLGAAVGTGDSTITVNATSSGVVPFPIVIDGERMTVTLVSGTTWSVTRGTAAGEVDPPATHLISAKVMSTPFPLFTLGTATRIMQMCIAKESWEPVPRSPTQPDCDNEPTSPTACTQNTTTIIDGGDGIMIRG
jgi:hypothetical protein